MSEITIPTPRYTYRESRSKKIEICARALSDAYEKSGIELSDIDGLSVVFLAMAKYDYEQYLKHKNALKEATNQTEEEF